MSKVPTFQNQSALERDWRHVVGRCWEDDAFRSQLQARPAAVLALEQAGWSCRETDESHSIQQELVRRAEAGIPESPDRFAQTQLELVALWQREFEPASGHDSRLPFADVLSPLVQQQLERTSRLAEWLAPPVIDQLRRSALEFVVPLAAQALQMEFALGRLENQTYAEFSERARRTRLADVFAVYPALQELMESAIGNWLANIGRMLNRLENDVDHLQTAFDSCFRRPIQSLQTGLSDAHCGGQSVISLSMNGGERIVYKPRDVGLEAAYNGLLAWICRAGFRPALKNVRVLGGDGYGWVEHVATVDCRNDAESRLYFHRAGALAALWWALDGVDMHMGNIRAFGAQPVLIDVETFFHNSPISAADAAIGLGQLSFFPR